jgi:hypothetical protein
MGSIGYRLKGDLGAIESTPTGGGARDQRTGRTPASAVGVGLCPIGGATGFVEGFGNSLLQHRALM